MSTSTFTLLHVLLSLVGIASGLIVLALLLRSRLSSGWTAMFLATTILTSVTGFFFPREHLLPSHVVGVLSLVLLAVATVALYRYALAGASRWLFVATAVASLYLNVFVGIVQSFGKISLLQPLAPTQSEPPFVAAQAIVLIVFVGLGVLALRRFHPQPESLAAGGATTTATR